MIRIYMPWNNLNCLGISMFRDTFYLDIYPIGKSFGIFARVNHRRYWWCWRSLITGRVRRDWC